MRSVFFLVVEDFMMCLLLCFYYHTNLFDLLMDEDHCCFISYLRNIFFVTYEGILVLAYATFHASYSCSWRNFPHVFSILTNLRTATGWT